MRGYDRREILTEGKKSNMQFERTHQSRNEMRGAREREGWKETRVREKS